MSVTMLMKTSHREFPWEEFHVLFEVTTGHTERGVWEHHTLARLTTPNATERNKIDALTKLQLSSFLMSLVAYCEQHKAHTPPITTNEIVPFPWRVSVLSCSGCMG